MNIHRNFIKINDELLGEVAGGLIARYVNVGGLVGSSSQLVDGSDLVVRVIGLTIGPHNPFLAAILEAGVSKSINDATGGHDQLTLAQLGIFPTVGEVTGGDGPFFGRF